MQNQSRYDILENAQNSVEKRNLKKAEYFTKKIKNKKIKISEES